MLRFYHLFLQFFLILHSEIGLRSTSALYCRQLALTKTMNACMYVMLVIKMIGVVISLASQLVCKAKNKIFGVVNDKKACREGIFVLLVTQRYT